VIRKRGGSLQVQVFAGRDPLTGRKRWLSRQVRGQTKAAYREAKKVAAMIHLRPRQPSEDGPCAAAVVLPAG
jgi:hypothetical protein